MCYLDGGNVEWCGDPKDRHYDGLVFFVDEDFHVSDVFFSGHLGDVLIGDIGFSSPAQTKRLTTWSVAAEMAVHTKHTLTSGSAALPSAPSDAAWLLRSDDWPAPSGGLVSSPPLSSRSAVNERQNSVTSGKRVRACCKKEKEGMANAKTYMQNTDV